MGEAYYVSDSHGTQDYWKHPSGLLYTDSVKDFAEEHGSYWTLDVVGSYLPVLRKHSFLIVFFDVDKDHCTFHVREDVHEPDVVYQYIPFTDMTVSLKLYLVDGILMFPSDY